MRTPASCKKIVIGSLYLTVWPRLLLYIYIESSFSLHTHKLTTHLVLRMENPLALILRDPDSQDGEETALPVALRSSNLQLAMLDRVGPGRLHTQSLGAVSRKQSVRLHINSDWALS